jgi:penicillin-binding protein 1A
VSSRRRARRAVPSSCDLSRCARSQIGENSFVYAADGSLLGSIPAERNRTPVALWRSARGCAKATVAIEDHRFYEHGGVDYEGIARAPGSDLSAATSSQGGSTITQQLVRNLYISKERTLKRKLKEACLAIKLSRRWSKDRILTEYLNQVYYGNHAYGIEAAAQTYFSKHARQLTPRQAALLAGLPQAPSSTTRCIARCGARGGDEVLRAMLDVRRHHAAQYRTAVAREPRLGPAALHADQGAVLLQLRPRQLIASTARTRPLGRPARLHDDRPAAPACARKGDHATRSTCERPGRRGRLDQPGQRRDPRDDRGHAGRTGNQFNLVAQARGSPGSTFKVIVLTARDQRGHEPDSTYYTSAPFHYQPDPYTPPGTCRPTTTRTRARSPCTQATLRSDNTVYAQLTLDVGPTRSRRWRTGSGSARSSDVVPAMGLGADAISPLEEASRLRDARRRRHLLEADGDPQRSGSRTARRTPDAGWGKPQRKRVISDGVAYEVTADPAGRTSSAARAWALLRPARRGQDRHDRQPRGRLVLGLRAAARGDGLGRLPAGRDPDGERPRISVAGGTFPATIWHLFMEAAVANRSRSTGRSRSTRSSGSRGPGPVRLDFALAAADLLQPPTSTRRTRPRQAPPPPRRSPRLHLRRRPAAASPPPRRLLRPSRRPPPPVPSPPAIREAEATRSACSRETRRAPGRARRVAGLLAACAIPDGGLFRAARFRGPPHLPGLREQFLHGPLPYRDVFVEYPPGAFAVFMPPTAFGAQHYNAAFKAEMALCGARDDRARGARPASSRRDARSPARRASALLASLRSALGPISLNTYDAWPALLTVLALTAAPARLGSAGARVLGLAVSAKVLPAGPSAAGGVFVWRRAGIAAAGRALGGVLIVVLAVVVPFAAYDAHGVAESFRSQATRGLQVESLGASLLLVADKLGLYTRTSVETTGVAGRNLNGLAADAVAVVTLVLEAAAVIGVWLLYARARDGRRSCRVALRRRGRRFPRLHEGLLAAVPRVARAARRARRQLARDRADGGALVLAQVWFFHYPRALPTRLAGVAAGRPRLLVVARSRRWPRPGSAAPVEDQDPVALEDEPPLRVARAARRAGPRSATGASRSA